MAGADYFSVPIFFIVFRECLEASIIVSVLLAFIKKSTSQSLPLDTAAMEKNQFLSKKLVRQVWFGAGMGLLICFIIGGAFIGAFYALQKNLWGSSEELWEGCFSLVATTLITVMGLAMLRINKLKDKWTNKLAASYEKKSSSETISTIGRWQAVKAWTRKYSMFMLPFVTVLREGLEAVVFVGGVGLSTPAKAFPIPVILGLLAGFLVGFFIYKGNRYMSIEYFLIASTWILYLVGAGLFSKSVGYFETYRWNKMTGGDASENGSGPGSYNIRWTIWHVNHGNPEIKTSGYGWQIFNAILGWNNTGTYGTVLSYIFYWVAITVALIIMRLKETHPEHSLVQLFSRKKGRSGSIEKSSSTCSETFSTEQKDLKSLNVHPIEIDRRDSYME